MTLSLNYPADLTLASLLANTRVIPAEKARDLRQIADSTAEAMQRIAQAEQHCTIQLDRVRQSAWDKGYQNGLAAASEKMLTVLRQADQRRASSETQLVELVLETVRTLVGEQASDIITPAVAVQALRKVCEQHASVVVYVHPESSAALQRRLQDNAVSLGPGVRFDVQQDPAMDKLDCRLETELGSVQAGLETQLAAIERALQSELIDA